MFRLAYTGRQVQELLDLVNSGQDVNTLWYPIVREGELSWVKSNSKTTPESVNITGRRGSMWFSGTSVSIDGTKVNVRKFITVPEDLAMEAPIYKNDLIYDVVSSGIAKVLADWDEVGQLYIQILGNVDSKGTRVVEGDADNLMINVVPTFSSMLDNYQGVLTMKRGTLSAQFYVECIDSVQESRVLGWYDGVVSISKNEWFNRLNGTVKVTSEVITREPFTGDPYIAIVSTEVDSEGESILIPIPATESQIEVTTTELSESGEGSFKVINTGITELQFNVV